MYVSSEILEINVNLKKNKVHACIQGSTNFQHAPLIFYLSITSKKIRVAIILTYSIDFGTICFNNAK